MTKILIIEEEYRTRRAYSWLLRSRGVEIIEARGPWEAAATFISERVDLILMNLKLSDIDSQDFLEIIREYDPEIKVITFDAQPVEQQKEIAPAAVDHFDKSQSISVLLEKINNILSSKSYRESIRYRF